MSITIREYVEADKTQVAAWLEELQDYLIKLDPDNRLRRQPEYGEVFSKRLFHFIAEGQGKIYLAMNENRAVGFVAGAVDKQTYQNLLEINPTKLGVISALFVDEAFRGKGIGSQLMKKIEKYFTDLDCDSLWVNIVAFNPAHEIYQKFGFHDREIGMLKKII